MCYVICIMCYVVQDFYVSYQLYVVQKTLNALIIPYMVMHYVVCGMWYVLYVRNQVLGLYYLHHSSLRVYRAI